MRELNRTEYGRVIAALQEYGNDHPDAEEADEYHALAELFTRHRVLIETADATDQETPNDHRR